MQWWIQHENGWFLQDPCRQHYSIQLPEDVVGWALLPVDKSDGQECPSYEDDDEDDELIADSPAPRAETPSGASTRMIDCGLVAGSATGLRDLVQAPLPA